MALVCDKCMSEKVVFGYSPVYVAGNPRPWIKTGILRCLACGFEKKHMEVIGGDMSSHVEELKAQLVKAMEMEAWKQVKSQPVSMTFEFGPLCLEITMPPNGDEIRIKMREWLGSGGKRGLVIRLPMNQLPFVKEGGEYQELLVP